MRRNFYFLVVLLLVAAVFTALKIPGKKSGNKSEARPADSWQTAFYHMGLENKIDFGVFSRAMEGQQRFPFLNDSILTIIDFTKASTEERLFILNIASNKILFESLVAHGRNTGVQMPLHFSNQKNSKMSSPGFYTTSETYRGKHGYSLRLDGLEPGVNDQARERAIVIHGADYVSEKFIDDHGRLGRSWGCPALPKNVSSEMIDLIKNGSCLYIHTSDEWYLENSVL